MKFDAKLRAQIVERWQNETGMVAPFPVNIARWIEIAENEEVIFAAISKVGRKIATAAGHGGQMHIGQAVRYAENIIQNSNAVRPLTPEAAFR